MKEQMFSEAMGKLSDKYITEAINYSAKKKQKNKLNLLFVFSVKIFVKLIWIQRFVISKRCFNFFFLCFNLLKSSFIFFFLCFSVFARGISTIKANDLVF